MEDFKRCIRFKESDKHTNLHRHRRCPLKGRDHETPRQPEASSTTGADAWLDALQNSFRALRALRKSPSTWPSTWPSKWASKWPSKWPSSQVAIRALTAPDLSCSNPLCLQRSPISWSWCHSSPRSFTVLGGQGWQCRRLNGAGFKVHLCLFYNTFALLVLLAVLECLHLFDRGWFSIRG